VFYFLYIVVYFEAILFHGEYLIIFGVFQTEPQNQTLKYKSSYVTDNGSMQNPNI